MSRETADQGDFFYAFVKTSSGKVIPHPVFILGKHDDSNDEFDVIACLRTSQRKRSEYDIETEIRGRVGWVRTNKILLIGRSDLDNKMPSPNVTEDIKKEIINKATKSINLKASFSREPFKFPDS